MKKLTSVLLSMVMLMSVLCMPTLAAGSANTLNANATYNENTGIVELVIRAAALTTNGKFTVTFDDECLSYVDSELAGTLTDTVVDGESITMSYASSTEDAVRANEAVAVLRFLAKVQKGFTLLEVMVLECNSAENLHTALPAVVVSFQESNPPIPPVTPNPPINPNPPVDDPDDGKDDEQDKPGIDIEVPKLTEEKYESIVAQYSDIENYWAEESIVKAINAGLFNGTSDNTFAPGEDMSRAMFATVLYRLSGEPTVSGNMPFSDVASSKYYYDAVIWAYSNGIITGVTTTEFAPDADVTREQMVTMLYRYAKYINDDVSASENLDDFGDANAVDGWATEAMKWAVAEGIINGSNGNLNPADNSTRAQIATVLVRYVGL